MFSLFLPMKFPQKFPQSNFPQHPTASWHRAHRARAAQNVGGAANSPTFSRFAAFSAALISCPKGTAVLGTGWDGRYNGVGTIEVMAPILLTTYMGKLWNIKGYNEPIFI